MEVLLYPNPEKDHGLLCTRACAAKLRELAVSVLLDERFREELGGEGYTYGRLTELLPRCDVLMPIGGDGTIMRAVRHAITAGKPILGVNAGRVGFLTQLERHELDHLRLLAEGRYAIHEHMMLEAELCQGGEGRRRRYAGLNDVVISRGGADRIVDIEVSRNNERIAHHRADGIVFATPTGSTAYSLSAGGPIIDPSMNLLTMTAICSHTTWVRGIVLPAEGEYTVISRSEHNLKGLTVTVDGRRVGKLFAGQELFVRKSAARARFVELGLCGFFERVGQKLTWGR